LGAIPRPVVKSDVHHSNAEVARTSDFHDISKETKGVTLGGFTLLLVTAVCMAGANVLLKNGIAQAGGFEPSLLALWQLARQPAVVGGVLLTAAGGLMWFRVLARQKLSTCYPLFVSLTYFLITLGAVYFLHEKISLQKLAGLAAMLVGIAVVARG
jgi:drug/metabolite transporter (DMT)-like permease